MSDNSSSGKSKEEVAFDILSKLKGVGIWGENNKEAILDMYAECLIATSGLRPVKGNTLAPQTIAQSAMPAPVEYVPGPAAPAQTTQGQGQVQSQAMTPLQAELHNLQQALK